MVRWFIIRNGTEEVVSGLRLKEMAVLGHLHTTDLIRREDMDTPKMACEVSALFPTWHIIKASNQQGPFTSSDILDLAEAGTITEDDFLRRFEDIAWATAASIDNVCQQIYRSVARPAGANAEESKLKEFIRKGAARWRAIKGERAIKELKQDKEHTLSDNALWYLLRGSGRQGPFNTFQIREQIRSGKLSPDDFILHPETSLCTTVRTANCFDESTLLASFPSVVAQQLFLKQIVERKNQDRAIPFAHKLMAHKEAVYCLAFSRDGKLLASGGKDTTIRLWDMASLSQINWCAGHSGAIVSLGFSNKDKALATSSLDGTVRVWRLPTGKETLCLNGADTELVYAGFTGTGKRLVTVGRLGNIHCWNKAGEVKRTFDAGHALIASACLSPDGCDLFAVTVTDELLKWNIVGHNTSIIEKAWIPSEVVIRRVTTSRDGTRVAVGGGCLGSDPPFTLIPELKRVCPQYDMLGEIYGGSVKGVIIVWDGDLSLQRYWTAHVDEILGIAISPCSTLLASASADRTVRLWDLVANRLLCTFRGHEDAVECVAFSPDGKWLASGSVDSSILLWDLTSLPLKESGDVVAT